MMIIHDGQVCAEITGATREEWSEAIFESHPCRDHDAQGCDVETARREGFLEAASWLLHGATETPDLDKFEEAHGIVVTGDMWLPGWGEWHDRNGVKCPECDGYNYPEEDGGELAYSTCANCRADLEVTDA